MGRTAAIILGYVVLFVAFDTQATLFEIAPGVSLWYPSAGLNLALVLVFGVWYTPVLFAALMASGLWISDPAIAVHHLVLPNLAIALGNGAVAWLMRRTLNMPILAAPGSMVRLVGAMAALAAWNAWMAPAAYLLTGLDGYALETIPTTAFKWWIGDWAGMLTLTPPLLLGALLLDVREAPEAWSRALNLEWPHRPGPLAELAGEILAVVLSLFGAFHLFTGPYLLYLCFLPVLWMALRHGLARGAIGVLLVNLGAVMMLSGGSEATSILGLQLFIVSLALTGLVVGALVSEREHAVRTLRRALAGGEEGAADVASDRSPQASLDDDVLRVADRVHSKQKQLAADATLLQRQNERKDQLFGIIAHDLQGAIGTSGGLAEVVETEADTLSRDMIETFGRHLGQSIERAQNLLDSLLKWAQVYVEGEAEEPEAHEVEAVVEPALQHVKPDAEKKGLTLVHDLESDLVVRGHSVLIRAVIRNLLTNAIKFTEEGGRVVVRATEGEDEATLCVRDNGIGIPEDKVESLFEPAQGTVQSGTEGEQGSGFGLVLCREIVEQYGGKIWADSAPGEGTRVCFTLPLSSGKTTYDGVSPNG